jgi:hypothetical protein
MAAIAPVELQIAAGNGYGEQALVVVDYEISATDDDIVAGTAYHEVVQLFLEGRHVLGRRPSAVPVSGGILRDGIVTFTANQQSYVHGAEKLLPLASLEGGLGPFDRDAVQARVTLTPLPPSAISQSSNTVILDRPPVVEA